LTVPIALVVATVLTNCCLLLFGVSDVIIRDWGLMFQNTSGAQVVPLLLSRGIGELDLMTLAGVAGDMVAVAAMAVLTILLNSTSIELETRVDTDFDHELKIHGVANLVAASSSGYFNRLFLRDLERSCATACD
jgi:sulfate permease, SulP family